MRIQLLGLVTNVKALQAFHVLRQGGAILVAILLAKSSLSTAQIGAFEMLLYVGSILTFFWVSGFVQGLLSIHPRLDDKGKAALVFNAYLLFTGISLLIFILLFFLKPQMLYLLTNQTELDYYEPFLLFLLLNIPAHLLENFYLLYQRPAHILVYGLVSFFLHTLAVMLPIYLGWGFVWSFYALILTGVIKHLWLLGFVLQRGHFTFQPGLLSMLLSTSFPLVLYALVGGFNQSFDNWLVNFIYQGDEEVFAIFRYGARELPFALALANAFSTAMLPQVAGDLIKALSQIKEKSRKLFHLLFPFSIFLMLTSERLFPLVFSEAFDESVIIFNIYLLIIISRLLFPRTVLVGLGDNRPVLYISIIELAVNIACSFCLVYLYGLAGIAMATLIAFSLEKILLCWYLYRKYDIPPGRYADLRWFTAYSIVLIGGFILFVY